MSIAWIVAGAAGLLAGAGWLEVVMVHRINKRRLMYLFGANEALLDYALQGDDSLQTLAEENTRLSTLCDQAQARALTSADLLDDAQETIKRLELQLAEALKPRRRKKDQPVTAEVGEL